MSECQVVGLIGYSLYFPCNWQKIQGTLTPGSLAAALALWNPSSGISCLHFHGCKMTASPLVLCLHSRSFHVSFTMHSACLIGGIEVLWICEQMVKKCQGCTNVEVQCCRFFDGWSASDDLRHLTVPCCRLYSLKVDTGCTLDYKLITRDHISMKWDRQAQGRV